MHSPNHPRAYTLLETMFVLSIIFLLTAMALPLYATTRGKAREVACGSNLRQIGLGLSMYMQDSGGTYPYAVDAIDRKAIDSWDRIPEFQRRIPLLPYLHEALMPYVGSPAVFHCPSDSGYQRTDFTNAEINAYSSAYETFGSSYFYRTELAARQIHESALPAPDSINVIFDPVGQWHGTLTPLAQRYNVLYADGHVKNVNRTQITQAWWTQLQDSDD